MRLCATPPCLRDPRHVQVRRESRRTCASRVSAKICRQLLALDCPSDWSVVGPPAGRGSARQCVLRARRPPWLAPHAVVYIAPVLTVLVIVKDGGRMQRSLPAYRDNSAGRLRSILEQARSLEASQPAVIGWSAVFGRQYPGSWTRLARDISETALLPDLTRADLCFVPMDTLLDVSARGGFQLDGVHTYGTADVHMSIDAALRNFLRLEALNMGDFLAPISDKAIRDLRVCEAVLQAGRPAQVVDARALARLGALIDEAIQIVENTEGLEASTKELLRERLTFLQDAVDLIRVRGARGVQIAAEALALSLTSRKELIDPSQARATTRKITAVLSAVALVTGAVNGPFDLVEHVRGAVHVGPAAELPSSEPPAIVTNRPAMHRGP